MVYGPCHHRASARQILALLICVIAVQASPLQQRRTFGPLNLFHNMSHFYVSEPLKCPTSTISYFFLAWVAAIQMVNYSKINKLDST